MLNNLFRAPKQHRMTNAASSIFFLLCLSILSLTSTTSQAQDAQSRVKQLIAMDLGDLLSVDIATGTPKEVSEAPAVVSVITEEDIKAIGTRTLSEALESVPGLHVSTSQFRLQKLFSIRGIQTDLTPQTLVLLDGNKINQITLASIPAAFHFPVHAIKRIEVIRGPGSAVYGADAFSGVINIISKKSEDLGQNQLGATLGSFNSAEIWINGAGKLGDTQVSLLADMETTDGDDGRVTPYGSLKTDRTLYNLHLNLEGHNWSMTNWYYRIEAFMGNAAAIYANDVDFDVTYAWNSKFDYLFDLDENFSVNLDASVSQVKLSASFRLFPEGTWPVGNDGNLLAPPFLPVSFPDGVIGKPGAEQTRYELNLVSLFQPSDHHRLRLAAGGYTADVEPFEVKNFGPGVLDGENFVPVSNELVDVTGTPFNYLPPYERDLWYLSIQDEWKINPSLELTAGIRYDHYSDFGSTTNPRLALVWKVNSKTTTKFLYGSAFRVATATESSAQNNPATLGNPDIQPEKIDTAEIVFNYQLNERLKGNLNLYRYDAEDLIILDQFLTNQNLGKQEGQGVELEIDWRADDNLTIKGHLTVQSAEESINNTDKALVPGTLAFADVRYTFNDNWQLTVQNYWVKDRKREVGDSRPGIDDYAKTDVNLIYQPDSQWLARLQIKNLFDEDIRHPIPNSGLFGLSGLGQLLGLEIPDLGFPDDTPMEGRAIYATLEYNF